MTALECDSSRRTRCGSASIVPLPNIASNEARIAAAPTEARAAGVDAADLVVVGPERHEALDVAPPHRFVELELDVVGGDEGRVRAAWGGPWMNFFG